MATFEVEYVDTMDAEQMEAADVYGTDGWLTAASVHQVKRKQVRRAASS